MNTFVLVVSLILIAVGVGAALLARRIHYFVNRRNTANRQPERSWKYRAWRRFRGDSSYSLVPDLIYVLFIRASGVGVAILGVFFLLDSRSE